jgi:hypothetical protein
MARHEPQKTNAPSTDVSPVPTKSSETPSATSDTTPPDTAALNARIAELEAEKAELERVNTRLEEDRAKIAALANEAALKAAAAHIATAPSEAARVDAIVDTPKPRKYVVGDAGGYFEGQVLRKGDVVTLTGDQKPSRTWKPLTTTPGTPAAAAQTEPVAEQRASNTAI